MQSYLGEKTTLFLLWQSSTVLLQLDFYLQKLIFYNVKINHSSH